MKSHPITYNDKIWGAFDTCQIRKQNEYGAK